MSRRPTLKLPAKAPTPSQRTHTVRPTAPKPKRAGGVHEPQVASEAAAAAPAPAKARPPQKPRGKPAPGGKPAAGARGKPTPRGKPGEESPFRKARPRPAEPAATTRPAPVPRPKPAPAAHREGEPPRLSKLMSEQGLCSRREADEWIENGWVRVDGKVVDQLGTRVAPDARIEVDPAARRHQSERVTILLHKPVGYVSGQAEDDHRPAAVLLRPENRWAEDPTTLRFKAGHLRGLAPAGRLDIDSTGLLVFTQDGRIARRLIGEDSGMEKEYLVRVEGTLSPEGLKLLNHGLALDGAALKPARVSWQNEDQLRFVLREGKKRQIRRMCELVGLKVVGLKRIRIGSVVLGKLPPGQWRYLRADEKF